MTFRFAKAALAGASLLLGAQPIASASLLAFDDTLWDLLRTSTPGSTVSAKIGGAVWMGQPVQPPQTKPAPKPAANSSNQKPTVSKAASVPTVPLPNGAPAGSAVPLTLTGTAPGTPPLTLTDGTLWDYLRTSDPSRPPVSPGAEVNPAGDPNASATNTGGGAKRRGMFGGFFDPIGSSFKRLGKQLDTNIKVTGQQFLGFHMENVSGNRESYMNGQYFGRQGAMGAYNLTDLTVQGTVAKYINFSTRISNQFYSNPNDNRFAVNFQNKNLKADLGQIQAGITGNTLIDFSRSLTGVQLTSELFPGFKYTTLYSQTRAQTRTITINGANRSGPYYVYAGQVVDGSVQVRVNDQRMEPGRDYTLDPYTGELNFQNGKIIGELEVIAVTFESFGYNNSPGTLTGHRLDFTGLRNTKFGLAMIDQVNRNSNNPLKDYKQQFYGYNNPATPYVLDYPVEITLVKDADGNIISSHPTKPITVQVDGFPQTYGVDYAINPALPNRIFFSRPLNANQIVTVTYIPLRNDTSPGNRSVMGLDGTFFLGKTGSITAELAKSTTGFSNGPISDSAWQLRGALNFMDNRLNWNWNLRNIGQNFSAIESPGFRRNEKGFSTSLDYSASKNLKLQASIDRSTRPSYDYSTLGSGSSTNFAQSQGNDQFKQLSLTANWMLGQGSTLALTHNKMHTNLSNGGYTTYLTDSLTYGASLGQLKLDLNFGRNVNRAQSIFNNGTTGSTTTGYGTTAYNGRLGLGWRVSKLLGFNSAISASRMTSLDGNKNTAKDLMVGLEAEPLPKMRLQMQYQLQDSGNFSIFGNGIGSGLSSQTRAALSTLTRQFGGTGYSGGYSGSGYLGGGFNSGLGGFGNYSGGFGTGGYSSIGGLGGSSFAGRSRVTTLGWSYRPWESISLDVQYSKSASLGDYLYNSNQNNVTLALGYMGGDKLQFNAGITNQKINYVGETGGTGTNMFFINARTKPIGKLIANLGFQVMKSNTRLSGTGTGTGSGTGTGTGGGFGLGGGLGGYLGGGTGSAFGGGASNVNSYQIGLEYPLWGGYSLYMNMDDSQTAGYFASTQKTFRTGLNFDLTQNLRFILGWRMQQYMTKDTTGGSNNFNYRARSIDADLMLRF